jgi:hypothetical protein
MNAWTERRRADDEAEELFSGRVTSTALIDVEPLVDELRVRYADRPAPAPNSALEQVFAWGLRADEEKRRVPAVPSWSRRTRAVVAVLAATLVLGGLAVAGAEPAVQDAIADAAKVFGLDLPRSGPDAPESPSVSTLGRSPAAAGGAAPVSPGASPASSASSAGGAGLSTSSPPGAPASGVAPPDAGTAVDLPAVTLPAVDLPPVTLPDLPIDVPPVTLPPVDLPPVTLPPVDLPPIL